MVLGVLARGAMGRGRGATMARGMFKRKGGKNAPEVPASEQTVDVKATTVQPKTSLISSPSIDPTSISKATPSSNAEGLEGSAFRIKTTLVDINTLLKGSFALDQIREQNIKKGEQEAKRKLKEKELEDATKKNNRKFKLGRLVPTKAKGIFGNIINFFVTLVLGKLLFFLIDNISLFEKVLKGLVRVSEFLIEWGGKLLNVFVSLIDFGYTMYEGLRGTVGNLFGKEGLKQFDALIKKFNWFLNGVIAAILLAARMNMMGGIMGFGPGGILRRGLGRALPRFLIKNFTGVGGQFFARKLLASSAITKGTALATGVGTGTAIGTGTGVGTGTAGGTAGGMGLGVTAATVMAILGAGMGLAGAGEGIYAMGEWARSKEHDWKTKASSMGWWNPMKYWFGILGGAIGITNRAWSFIGGIIDILGAPFRMLGELIFWPFLSKEQKEQQRKKLVKYDTRIREQFRQAFNAIDIFGIVGDQRGSWGSIYGDAAAEEASESLGYNRDLEGKVFDEKTRKYVPLEDINGNQSSSSKSSSSGILGPISSNTGDMVGGNTAQNIAQSNGNNIQGKTNEYKDISFSTEYEEHGVKTFIVNQRALPSTSNDTGRTDILMAEGLLYGSVSSSSGKSNYYTWAELAKR